MSKNLDQIIVENSSFRDPAGFVFKRKGKVYRQINPAGREDYDLLMASRLYDSLIDKGFMVPHQEILENVPPEAYRIIQPQQIDFISYPYEWSFSMLKDAALLTLKIQRMSLEHGMSLKDASAYNVQFSDARPVFIDTLSFTQNDSSPWPAYRQFCQHFLIPLLLMAKRDIGLQALLKVHMDGIPLSLAAKLLPFWTKFSPRIFLHVHLHARIQAKHSSSNSTRIPQMTVKRKLMVIDSLISFVRSINWKPKKTEWGDYYSFTNYDDNSLKHKTEIVEAFLKTVMPVTCWDIGANNGYFTRIASRLGVKSVAFDIDPVAVENNYLQIKQLKEVNLLPLLCDVCNPSPAIGWHGKERKSLFERGRADLVMGLALIHHLAISNNLPLAKIAEFFSAVADNVIMEFVPKTDSKVQVLLASRKDIFPNYDQGNFEREFSKYFAIRDKQRVKNSERTLYLFSRL